MNVPASRDAQDTYRKFKAEINSTAVRYGHVTVSGLTSECRFVNDLKMILTEMKHS